MAAITREELERRKADYEAQIIALQGAIAAIDDLIKFLEGNDALTMDDLKSITGAQKVEFTKNDN
jgi:hypothetical protein